jgi:hypothetical protein
MQKIEEFESAEEKRVDQVAQLKREISQRLRLLNELEAEKNPPIPEFNPNEEFENEMNKERAQEFYQRFQTTRRLRNQKTDNNSFPTNFFRTTVRQNPHKWSFNFEKYTDENLRYSVRIFQNISIPLSMEKI